MEQRRPPTLLGEDEVSLNQADRLSGPEAAEVHRREEPDEAPAASTPVAAHVGHRRQEVACLLRIGDDARIDLIRDLRLLPANRRDRILTELPQVNRVVRGVDEGPPLPLHGLSRCRGAVELQLQPVEHRTGSCRFSEIRKRSAGLCHPVQNVPDVIRDLLLVGPWQHEGPVA